MRPVLASLVLLALLACRRTSDVTRDDPKAPSAKEELINFGCNAVVRSKTPVNADLQTQIGDSLRWLGDAVHTKPMKNLVAALKGATDDAHRAEAFRAAASDLHADVSRCPFLELLDLRASLPVVSVDQASSIFLDGDFVTVVPPLDETHLPQEIDLSALRDALVVKKNAWIAAHPAEPFPGRVRFHFDPNLRAYAVKAIFKAAAFAGYPNGEFDPVAPPALP